MEQGAPSVVAAGGGVGATDLLSSDRGEAFLLDFSASPERLAEQVWPTTLQLNLTLDPAPDQLQVLTHARCHWELTVALVLCRHLTAALSLC